MPRIQVNSQEITALRQRLSEVQTACSNEVNNVERVRTNLGWQIASQQGIDDRLNAIQRRLQAQSELMGQYTNFLSTVNDRFNGTDKSLREQARDVLYQIRQITANLRNIVPSRISDRNSASLAAIVGVGALFGAREVGRTGILGALNTMNDRLLDRQEKRAYERLNLTPLSDPKQRNLFEMVNHEKGSDRLADIVRHKAELEQRLAELDSRERVLRTATRGSFENTFDKELTIIERERNLTQARLDEVNQFTSITRPVPSSSTVTDPFGWSTWRNDGAGASHNGTDFGHGGYLSPCRRIGPPISTMVSGRVHDVGVHGSLGKFIVIEGICGNFFTYAHLNSIQVERNQNIVSGENIGVMGTTGFSTGVHLHLEKRRPPAGLNNRGSTPVDPYPYINRKPNQIDLPSPSPSGSPLKGPPRPENL